MKGMRRSFQFIPANNPGMLQSADILGADSIIFDLEDAVSLEEKDSARNLLREALKNFDYTNIEVVVRINPVDTPYFMDDIRTMKGLPIDCLMIPKATEESIKETLKALDDLGFKVNLIPLIETALGVEEAFRTVSLSDRIDAVLLGGEDLSKDLGVIRTKEGNEINYARTRVATACKARAITAIDTPFTDADDMEGLEKDTRYAKSVGFNSKSSINPRHIDTIHMVFNPTEKEIDYALRVMYAYDEAKKENKGVFSLDGKMVDAPIIARAEATLSKARMLGLIKEE